MLTKGLAKEEEEEWNSKLVGDREVGALLIFTSLPKVARLPEQPLTFTSALEMIRSRASTHKRVNFMWLKRDLQQMFSNRVVLSTWLFWCWRMSRQDAFNKQLPNVIALAEPYLEMFVHQNPFFSNKLDLLVALCRHPDIFVFVLKHLSYPISHVIEYS